MAGIGFSVTTLPACLADVVGGGVELCPEEDERSGDVGDVGGERVGEEVPRFLAGDVVHGDQVDGVHAVPEEQDHGDKD